MSKYLFFLDSIAKLAAKENPPSSRPSPKGRRGASLPRMRSVEESIIPVTHSRYDPNQFIAFLAPLII
jgi:hypothetical protein